MSRRIRDWKGIVLHHTASRDVPAEVIDIWHKKRGWKGIGYHFVVRKDGSLELGRSLGEVGAHCKGYNTRYIGIVLTGNFSKQYVTALNMARYSPTYEQYESLMMLVKSLMILFKIQLCRVFLHSELSATLCPGENFEKLMGELMG